MELDVKPARQAVKFRTVYAGVNFKGRCDNPECKAHKKRVWIPKGFGVFNMSKDRFKNKCPECEKVIDAKSIDNFGYRKAKIVVEGMRCDGEDNEEVNFEDEETRGKLRTFLESGDHLTEWGYMYIRAFELKPKE